MQQPRTVGRLVDMKIKWAGLVLVLASLTACGEPAASGPTTRPKEPARIDVVEGSTVSISRDPRDDMRFSATFTLGNTGGTAGRPKCDLYVGREKVRMRPMPILKPGQERYLERSVRVTRAVWEIDGDVYCK